MMYTEMILSVLLLLMSTNTIQAGYKCGRVSTGYGVSRGRIHLGTKYKMSDCATACTRRRASDMYIDGVTYDYYRRACYCERWMTSHKALRGYYTCLLVYTQEKQLSTEYSCDYKSGLVDGKTAFYVGITADESGCTEVCLQRKSKDNTINGAIMNSKKQCWCRKAANRISQNSNYQSCVLKRKHLPPIMCTFKNNLIVDGKYFNAGKSDSSGECAEICARKKWIDNRVNSATYSDSKNVCYCATSAKNMRKGEGDWASCFIESAGSGNFNCGKSPFKPSNSKDTWKIKRIVGGMPSPQLAWPWQVGIYLNGKFICGGTIISPRLILSAAHCFLADVKVQNYTLMLGDYDHSKKEKSERKAKIGRMIPHDFDHKNRANDIVVLESQDPISFNENVFPACLPPPNEKVKAGTKCYISGWGRVMGTGRYSDVLKHLPITMLTEKQCKEKNNMYQYDGEKMVCGMNPDSIDDTSCQGDSGGPLVCQRQDGNWVLQGVISHGSADCEGSIAYPVSTKVSYYINWILKLD